MNSNEPTLNSPFIPTPPEPPVPAPAAAPEAVMPPDWGYLKACGLLGGFVATALAATLVLGKVARPVSRGWPTSGPPSETEQIRAMELLEKSSTSLAEKVLPSVVAIDTASHRYEDTIRLDSGLKARLHDRSVETEFGIGSGVIVSAEGHIVTNHHVIRSLDLRNSEDRLDVRLYKTEEPEEVEVLGSDPLTDIALIKLKNPSKNGRKLSFLGWGDSDEMQMGSLVFAFGSPFGLSETMTTGRISNNHRTLKGGQNAIPYFQTDCVINPGNSGGPLVNYRGELIGINWAIYSNTQSEAHSWQGVGLVLPGNTVKKIVANLLAKKAPPIYVGVDFLDFRPKRMGISSGAPKSDPQVLISAVDAGSPAEVSGLLVGDLVTEVAGVPASSSRIVWSKIREMGAQGHREVSMEIKRGESAARKVLVSLARQ